MPSDPQLHSTETHFSFDYASRYAEAQKEMAKWLADGSVKRKFHIVEGLSKAPEALPMLFTGGNTGKL
jgi:NADPH-dependent curcumin reductase CurA